MKMKFISTGILPEKSHPWPLNSKVKTTKTSFPNNNDFAEKVLNNPEDFTADTLINRKWNELGFIYHISNSHKVFQGLCYRVFHPIDNTEAYYNPEELKLMENQYE